MKRRPLLVLAAAAAVLAGCGFELRRAPDFAFNSIAVAASPNSAMANELKRSIAADGKVTVVDPSARDAAQVVMDFVSEQREKVVVGMSATGQVREFQLRTRLKFRLRTPQGKELIPET